MAIAEFLRHIGSMTVLLFQIPATMVRRPFEIVGIIDQLDHLGVKSLSIVNITALFTGMVLALQTAYSLATFGAKQFVAQLVALSIVRELGPVLTALMVGGRVGAGITAEVGSMQVTEQIDAMRALGADPVKKIVMPKVVATVVILPILTILADFLGIVGGLFISWLELKQAPQFYMANVLNSLTIEDIMSGVGKTAFFGLFISLIGCYNGLTATGGASGVGSATTNTVVSASISILISNFFITKLFMILC